VAKLTLSPNRILDTNTRIGAHLFAHSVLVYPSPRAVTGKRCIAVGDTEGTLYFDNLCHALFAADGLRGEKQNRDGKGRKASVIYSRNGSAPYYLLDGKPSDIEVIEAIEGGAL